jgi:uncharacterized protein
VARGTVIRAAHFPGRAAIEAYGNGGFRFAGMSHRGSLLCLPTGMHAWDILSPRDVTLATLSLVLEAADRIDVLMIGMGNDIARLDPEIRAAMRERQIIVEAISTGSAVRTYNILLAEQRAVAAALIAVENVR